MCEIYEEIAAKVEQIWNKASVPVLHRVRIISLIKREHEKLLNVLKSYHGRKKNVNFQHKVQAFKKEAKALFDVAACKCNDFELCHCEKSRKVHIREQPFITDQRSARVMAIGSVDLRTTQQLQKRASRKMRDLNLEEARIAKLQKSELATSTESLETSDEYVVVEEDAVVVDVDKDISLAEGSEWS